MKNEQLAEFCFETDTDPFIARFHLQFPQPCPWEASQSFSTSKVICIFVFLCFQMFKLSYLFRIFVLVYFVLCMSTDTILFHFKGQLLHFNVHVQWDRLRGINMYRFAKIIRTNIVTLFYLLQHS